MNAISDGDFKGAVKPSIGLFLHCTVPETSHFFADECIPDLNKVETLFMDLDDNEYPHAWRGAVICFVVGLGLLVP